MKKQPEHWLFWFREAARKPKPERMSADMAMVVTAFLCILAWLLIGVIAWAIWP